jgi:microcystin-dependent protein
MMPAMPNTLIRFLTLFTCVVLILTVLASSARSQTPYLGEIDLVPYNFSPVGWADCNGQLLPISSNTALFSLLGTTYGGDGKSNFALPDLRDRVPIDAGQGPGLSNYIQGESGGEYQHTLIISEMPAHTHFLKADTSVGTSARPANALMAKNGAAISMYRGTFNQTMSAAAFGPTGGGQPHNNLQPYLGLMYIIALQGIYPPRN